jgi:hypothetical protein
MICLEERHFNLNKILLQVIGLWPYQQTKFVQIQFAVLFGILATAIIFQVRHYFHDNKRKAFKPYYTKLFYYILYNFTMAFLYHNSIYIVMPHTLCIKILIY